MRADAYLVANGYIGGREHAKALILAGCVTVDGKVLKKASDPIAEELPHEVIVNDPQKYVGRGGLKLEAALDAFGIDPSGMTALDIGASTGGFTDCLLQRGARHVYAVDAGAGQLAEKLRNDPRVTSMEHLNARELTRDIIPERVDLIVMDVSFISATYILPRFPDLLRPDGTAVCLIKPQFEVGKERIGKGGIVKDPAAHRYAVERVTDAGRSVGLIPTGLISSPIEGGDGNREFLVRFSGTDPEGRAVNEAQIRAVTGI